MTGIADLNMKRFDSDPRRALVEAAEKLRRDLWKLGGADANAASFYVRKAWLAYIGFEGINCSNAAHRGLRSSAFMRSGKQSFRDEFQLFLHDNAHQLQDKFTNLLWCDDQVRNRHLEFQEILKKIEGEFADEATRQLRKRLFI